MPECRDGQDCVDRMDCDAIHAVYDGLAAMVRQHLGADPLSGHGFVFVNS